MTPSETKWHQVNPSDANVKANKGFKVYFMEQPTDIKVDFEGQDSFDGLSQTVKFFLEGLYGASSPLICWFPLNHSLFNYHKRVKKNDEPFK